MNLNLEEYDQLESRSEPGAARLPPFSVEAEQSVLGALLLDNNAWDRIADRLSVADFYRTEHRLIFECINQLVNRQQPIDVLTLSETLKNTAQLEAAGDEPYLFELAKNTPSAANIVSYANIVREKAILRRLITASAEISESALSSNGTEINTIMNNAEQKIYEITQSKSNSTAPRGAQDLLSSTMERIDKMSNSKSNLTGLSSGFKELDRITAGLQDADLVIIAARPSMGKTVLGMNIAQHVALKTDNKPVLIFSMEMPAESIVMRMISDLSGVSQNKVKTGDLNNEDWSRVTGAVAQLSEAKLFIDESPALSPTEVRSRSRRFAREYGGISLIVLDYLQLMEISGRTENRTTEVSKISRSLKALAKELNCPVIALSQLNRSLEARTDKRPIMSDLRESGAIEQDADLILFIYRDEVYNEDSLEKGVAEIIIGKHRNGEIGKIRLNFHGQYMRFNDQIINF